MKFGCCVSMFSTPEDPAGLRYLEAVEELGFDYVELPVAELMLMDDAAFLRLLKRLSGLRIRCESCNNFFPKHVRLTGDGRNEVQIAQYLEGALPRIADLGAQSVVFGSAAAKNVPDGFSFDRAWEQIGEDLLLISDAFFRVLPGVNVAIEPVCRRESNILLNYREAVAMARSVNRSNIRCLVDYYHMAVEGESPKRLLEGGSLLQHAHISNPAGRGFPGCEDGQDYAALFETFKAIGYDARVSIEGFSEDFAGDAARALECLKKFVG